MARGHSGVTSCWARCSPLRGAQAPSLQLSAVEGFPCRFPSSCDPSLFLYLWFWSQPGEAPGCCQTLELGWCLQGTQRKGKIPLPTLPLRLPSDLSLWTLSSFPLCWLGGWGEGTHCWCPGYADQQFLPLSCCRNVTVTTVVQELTPEELGLGEKQSHLIPQGLWGETTLV